MSLAANPLNITVNGVPADPSRVFYTRLNRAMAASRPYTGPQSLGPQVLVYVDRPGDVVSITVDGKTYMEKAYQGHPNASYPATQAGSVNMGVFILQPGDIRPNATY